MTINILLHFLSFFSTNARLTTAKTTAATTTTVTEPDNEDDEN